MNSDELNALRIYKSSTLSDGVLNYLVKHPEAQDTLEGIAEWWLLEQRISELVVDLEVVLDDLVKRGFLLVSQCEGSRFYYRLNRNLEREIRSHLQNSAPGAQPAMRRKMPDN